MDRLQVGRFICAAGLDAGVRANWRAEKTSPGLASEALEKLWPLLGEGWLISSAWDVRPEPVIGLLRRGWRQLVFSLTVERGSGPGDHATALHLLVVVDDGQSISPLEFLQCWHSHCSRSNADHIPGDRAVDTAAFMEEAPVDSVVVRVSLPEMASGPHVALIDDVQARRIAHLAALAVRIERENDVADVVVVDNATAVRGQLANVVGLVRSHRNSALNWRVLSVEPRPDAERDLHQATALIPERVATHSDRPEHVDDIVYPTTNLGLARLLALADAIAKAAVERGAAEISLAELNSTLPPRADDEAGSSEHLLRLAQASLLKRQPALATGHTNLLPELVNALHSVPVALQAVAAAQLSQSCYDWLRGRHPDVAGQAQSWLDNLLDRLEQRMAAALSSSQRFSEPGEKEERARAGRRADEIALLDAFDRLAEIESLSPQRDQRMQSVADQVHLALGRLTFDGLSRVWPAHLKRGDQHASLGPRRPDRMLSGMAMILTLDTLEIDTAGASRMVSDLLGIDESVTTQRTGMLAADTMIAQRARRTNLV